MTMKREEESRSPKMKFDIKRERRKRCRSCGGYKLERGDKSEVWPTKTLCTVLTFVKLAFLDVIIKRSLCKNRNLKF